MDDDLTPKEMDAWYQRCREQAPEQDRLDAELFAEIKRQLAAGDPHMIAEMARARESFEGRRRSATPITGDVRTFLDGPLDGAPSREELDLVQSLHFEHDAGRFFAMMRGVRAEYQRLTQEQKAAGVDL